MSQTLHMPAQPRPVPTVKPAHAASAGLAPAPRAARDAGEPEDTQAGTSTQTPGEGFAGAMQGASQGMAQSPAMPMGMQTGPWGLMGMTDAHDAASGGDTGSTSADAAQAAQPWMAQIGWPSESGVSSPPAMTRPQTATQATGASAGITGTVITQASIQPVQVPHMAAAPSMTLAMSGTAIGTGAQDGHLSRPVQIALPSTLHGKAQDAVADALPAESVPHSASLNAFIAPATPAASDAAALAIATQRDFQSTIAASGTPVTTVRHADLREALGSRLDMSIGQRHEQALIRLDPPNLGQIEIQIRHEAGAVQVHLRATHPEVAQQLQAMGDALRQELASRHAGPVSVAAQHTGAHAGQHEGQGRQGQETPQGTPGRALAEADGHTPNATGRFALPHEQA
ncbi:MAG: flagellar hook-length control protein FliK [Aquabacterium sp.]